MIGRWRSLTSSINRSLQNLLESIWLPASLASFNWFLMTIVGQFLVLCPWFNVNGSLEVILLLIDLEFFINPKNLNLKIHRRKLKPYRFPRFHLAPKKLINLCLQAPFFLLFLDCVFQLIHQHPTHFQFTSFFLLCLADGTRLPCFDTFIFNNERLRSRILIQAVCTSLLIICDVITSRCRRRKQWWWRRRSQYGIGVISLMKKNRNSSTIPSTGDISLMTSSSHHLHSSVSITWQWCHLPSTIA